MFRNRTGRRSSARASASQRRPQRDVRHRSPPASSTASRLEQGRDDSRSDCRETLRTGRHPAPAAAASLGERQRRAVPVLVTYVNPAPQPLRGSGPQPRAGRRPRPRWLGETTDRAGEPAHRRNGRSPGAISRFEILVRTAAICQRPRLSVPAISFKTERPDHPCAPSGRGIDRYFQIVQAAVPGCPRPRAVTLAQREHTTWIGPARAGAAHVLGVVIFSGSLPTYNPRVAVGGFSPLFLTSARRS